MKFEPKMSGTRVTEFNIDKDKIVFDTQFISLDMCIKNIHRQEAMDWILDTLRFTKGTKDGTWFATIDFDSIYKLTVLEHYPAYEAEFISYFGENWMEHYIRFNH